MKPDERGELFFKTCSSSGYPESGRTYPRARHPHGDGSGGADGGKGLDLWFEKVVKPRCKGEVYLTRFADDFVVNFQYQRDAERLQKNLTNRFTKFGLELAEERRG